MQKIISARNVSEDRQASYPEKPKYVVLFLSNENTRSVARDSVTKQPKGDSPSKDINIFLQK